MKFHESVQITIPANTSGRYDIKESFSKAGICKRVGLINQGNNPTEIINVKISDNRGNMILPFMPNKMLEQRQGGSFEDSLVPIQFDNRYIELSFDIKSSLANDYVFSLVFLFETKELDLINVKDNEAINSLNTPSCNAR